jgi:hypothetical protein
VLERHGWLDAGKLLAAAQQAIRGVVEPSARALLTSRDSTRRAERASLPHTL